MTEIRLVEWQALAFFEVDPELLDKDEVPWHYNDAAYRVEQGELVLNFAIQPAYRDVRINLTFQDHRLYELHAKDCRDVQYRSENGIETLEISLNEQESIFLRIKPHIELWHTCL